MHTIFVALNQPSVDVRAIFFFLYFLYKMVIYLFKVENYHFFTKMTRDKQDEPTQSVH